MRETVSHEQYNEFVGQVMDEAEQLGMQTRVEPIGGESPPIGSMFQVRIGDRWYTLGVEDNPFTDKRVCKMDDFEWEKAKARAFRGL